MEVQIINRGAVKLAGYVLKTSTMNGKNQKEIPQFWSEYLSGDKAKKLHGEDFVKDHAEFGVCFVEGSSGEMDYLIGVEIKEGSPEKPGYHYRELPAATYAVFSTPPADDAGFSAAIQKTWGQIWGEWLPGSGRKIDPSAFSFELYDERAMAASGKVCGIWIPVLP